MSEGTTYSIDSENVTSEEIDREVIIVNLLNGNYYSAVDLAALIWGRLQRGYSVGRIRGEILARFAEHEESIERDLSDFLANLESEGLIRAEGDESQDQRIKSGDFVEGEMPQSYQAPVLSSYSDMQDVLLLDPIHDVAEAGWPTEKPGGSK
jgi:hypothetical protein